MEHENCHTLVIDAGLNLSGGHHLAHLNNVVRALADDGRTCAILTNQSVDLTLVRGFPVHACLPATGYEGFLRAETGGEDQKRAAQTLALGFLQAERLLSRAERILVLNVTPVVLSAVLTWTMLRCKPLQAALSLYILTGSGVTAVSDGFETYDANKRSLFEAAIERLPKSVDRVRIHATSQTRRDELEYLGARNVSLYSFSMTRPRARRKHADEAGAYILLHAGDAKTEKGTPRLPALVDHFQQALPEQPLMLHLNDAEGQFYPTLEALRKRQSPMVLLQSGFLTKERYQALLENARIVVLLHETAIYRDMESGLFNECIATSIPVFCRRGTWSAQMLERADGHAFVYKDDTTLIGKIAQLLKADTPPHATFSHIAKQLETAVNYGPL